MKNNKKEQRFKDTRRNKKSPTIKNSRGKNIGRREVDATSLILHRSIVFILAGILSIQAIFVLIRFFNQ